MRQPPCIHPHAKGPFIRALARQMRRMRRKDKGPWIAGHIIAWTLGGKTEIENGRVECMDCAKKTHNKDTKAAAKAERMGGRKGQQARRKKNGSKFPKLTKEQRKAQYLARKQWAAEKMKYK